MDECPELRLVVFEVHSICVGLLLNEGMSAGNGNILNPHIGIVTATQLDLVYVVEVDDMDLLLLFVLLLLVVVQVLCRVHLEGLKNDEIPIGTINLVQSELSPIRLMRICVPEFTQLTVEGPPSIRSHILSDLLVLTATQPLPEAFEMDASHRTRALARGDERVRLFILLIRKADPAHSFTLLTVVQTFTSILFEIRIGQVQILFILGHLLLLSLRTLHSLSFLDLNFA